MNTSVRDAKVSDIPWVLDELRQFSAVFGTRKPLFPDDEDVALAVVQGLIENQLFLVAEIDAHPVGFIAGILAPHTFNPGITVLTEVFWWVAPDHRHSSAAAALYSHFMYVGKEVADWIVMTLEVASPVNADLFERRGFRLHERSYLLEVEKPDESIVDIAAGCSVEASV